MQEFGRRLHALIDIGQNEQAQEIAKLLLERSELSLPLRTEIERFVENLPSPWRLEIDRYILRRQPFQLSYQDAAGRLLNFTIRYAKIIPHEKRQYLDCWCEETEGNFDIEELQNNWSFRLDRIQDAAVMPISGEWRSHLAEIDVEMHLFAGLAFAYEAKPEDSTNEWIPNRQSVRRVVRRVSSTFWFIREVMQYTPDCAIASPESMRDRLKQKLRNLCRLYDMDTSK